MLNKLNQPKGSTIGVLKDGRSVQEAIDSLESVTYQFASTGATAEEITDALREASNSGSTLVFSPGTYSPGSAVTVDFPINLMVTAGVFLDFPIVIKGKPVAFNESVKTTLPSSVCPAGTTKFSGDFSIFSPGQVVGIKLGDNTNGSASYNNEAGWDFKTVQAASSTSLTLTEGIRWTFDQPEFVKPVYAKRFNGQVQRGSFTITGNFTDGISVGDVVRIENIDGTDGVNGKKDYFEMLKVSAITSSEITFETRTCYAHSNPWIILTNPVKGSSIKGTGRLSRLEVRSVDSPIVNGLDIDRLIVGLCHNINIGEITSRGVGEPSSVNFTFCFGRGFLYNVRASGSVAQTDNAALKIMSCPRLMVSKCSPHNSTATGSQGDYGFYIDAFYSPYWCWNDGMIVEGIVAERPRSPVTRAVWMFGLRNSVVDNVSGAQVFLQGCSRTVFTNIMTPDDLLELRDLVGCSVAAHSMNALVLGCWQSEFDLTTYGVGSGTNLNIAVRVGAGVTHPETGVNTPIGKDNLFNVRSYTTNASATTLNVSKQTRPVFGPKCMDDASVSKSLTLGSDISQPTMLPNLLTKAIDSGSGWVGGRTKGGFWLDGNWRDAVVHWNGRYLWVAEDGRLKAHTSKPDSDSPSGATVIGP